MDPSTINVDDPSYLIVSPSNSRPTVFELERGGSVFVGSGSNCRLMLPGDGVHPIHCMIWLDDQKQLKVQDWNTGETFLNDRKLEEDAEFKSGDILTVAEYRLIPVLTKEFHLGVATEILERSHGWDASTSSNRTRTETDQPKAEPAPSTVYPSLESLADDEDDDLSLDDLANASSTFAQTVDDTPHTQPPSLDHSSPAPVETAMPTGPSIKTGGFQYDVDADLNPEPDDTGFDDLTQDALHGGFAIDASMDFDPDEDDETAMLRVEVEQLRFEIAEKNATIMSIRDARANNRQEVIDEAQTEKLVNRLEELLAELQHSDDRVRNLEELLRLSDEATHAEKEERNQLEKWVSEIEQRVGAREQEHTAEIHRLTIRLERAQEDLKNTEGQINNLIQSQRQSGASDVESQELIEQSRQQNTELRKQVEELKLENDQLRQRKSAYEQGGCPEDQETIQELQDKLVKMQVESSRERAEMARRHAELERMRDGLQDQLDNAKSAKSGDSKITAMREHLREIHAQEKVEEEERRRNSLSGRIANLLSRLR